ncbi:MAG: indole-3-glycerol phosphate synthase TrpC [Deltaproteobacteria bacterium]
MANDTMKEIVAKKKERLALAKQTVPEEEMKLRAGSGVAPRPFMEAVARPRQISLIAEIKKRSPSAGMLVEDFVPAAIAAQYKEAGAQAISVLTEEDFFLGKPEYIQEVKTACDLPVLRKDFLLEPYHVYESRALGADAILLISELLSKDAIAQMLEISFRLGMAALIEAHSDKELKKVLGIKVPVPEEMLKKAAKGKQYIPFLVGINNRDLRTLQTDFKTTEQLYPLVPKDKPVVVESGIRSYQDVLFLKVLGVGAVLVGESILKSPDRKEAILDLMGW